MTTATLVARVLLAAVLAVAGAAKMVDRQGTRATARELGVPSALVGLLAVGLPVAELALAGAVVPGASARIAALAACALFLIFALVVSVALLRGRRPDCNCFGRLHSAPIGTATLARVVTLAAVAAFVCSRPARDDWILAGATAATLLLVGQAWVWVELLRRYGRALHRIEALERRVAPPFVLPDLAGEPVALEKLVERDGAVLLFTDPHCGACDLALEEAGELARGVVGISTGPRDEVLAKARAHALERVLIDERREVGELFGVRGYPTAVRVAADGAIGESAAGHAAVAALLRAVAPSRTVVGATS